jgi:RNA polymerase sigma-70 factor (ECF subfamily)
MTATSLSPPGGHAAPLDCSRLEIHLPNLYGMARTLCRSHDDAEDLVQDTCEHVLRRPRILRSEHVHAYLLRALKNTWINSNRARRTVLVSDEELETIIDPTADPAVTVEARAVWPAIRALAPCYRDAIAAVDVAGLTYKQAAKALGVPEGTVMSRLYRARRSVAAALP